MSKFGAYSKWRIAEPRGIVARCGLFVGFVLFGWTGVYAQMTWHVDDDATLGGDGAGWVSAYRYLQDALVVAQRGDEIHVAGGTYRPDKDEIGNVTIGDREATFELITGVAIKGGYGGHANLRDPDTQDITIFVSILSGNIGNSDVDSDNSYHVVTARDTGNSAVLYGFTITAGNSIRSNAVEEVTDEDTLQGTSGEICGGFIGIPCQSAGFCKLPVGGCCCDHAGVCTVPPLSCPTKWDPVCGCDLNTYANECLADAEMISLNNQGTCNHGGGILIERGNPTVSHCKIRGNSAAFYGGGMYVYRGNPTVTNCVFERNSAISGGAAAFMKSEASLQDCILRDNSARRGGAIRSIDSRLILQNCDVIRNSATGVGRGGGIYKQYGDATLLNCVIDSNHTEFGSGGGIYNSYGTLTLNNCLVVGNLAFGPDIHIVGGGLYDLDGITTLRNCTIFGNSAVGFGGGIYSLLSILTVRNSIAWANSDIGGKDESAQIHNNANFRAVTRSCVEGLDTLAGSGNIDADPLFVPGPGGCFYLSQTAAGQPSQSPCVDAGSDTAMALDLDMMTTRSDEGLDTGIVDMGYHSPVTGRSLVFGDFDRNTAVDLDDFANWGGCMGLPGSGVMSPCCRIFDFEHDGDVDLYDFAAFMLKFNP